MLNALIIAILSFMVTLPNETAPTKEVMNVQSVNPVLKVEQKLIPQEVKPVVKPAIDQTAIDKIDEMINNAKISIAVTERTMQIMGPERAVKELPTLEKKKARLVELENQKAQLLAP